MNRVKFEMSKATEKTLFGRKYATKKIKRNLSYVVSFYYDGILESHYFESAKKMRTFVNNIHELVDCSIPGVRIEKNWCYRDFTPRHKCVYISFKPKQFLLVEKY